MYTAEIATFAALFNVAVKEAYVLPAVFERTAKVAKMSVGAFINEATTNQALGEYIAIVARKVAAEDGYQSGL